MNRTLQYGEGLFETIKWMGRTKKLALHYERLRRSADYFNIPCPSYEEFVATISEKTGSRKGLYVKLLLLCEGEDYFPSPCRDYTLRVVVKELRPVPSGVKLCFSPFRRHSRDPLSRHKTTSYLFNVLVKRDALRRGFFDGIVLNERELPAETSSANLLLYRRGSFYTPPEEAGLLRGTTVSLLGREIGLREEYLKKEDLFGGFLFVVNSLLGVVPVVQIEDTRLKEDEKLTEELKTLLARLEELPPQTGGNFHEG